MIEKINIWENRQIPHVEEYQVSHGTNYSAFKEAELSFPPKCWVLMVSLFHGVQ